MILFTHGTGFVFKITVHAIFYRTMRTALKTHVAFRTDCRILICTVGASAAFPTEHVRLVTAALVTVCTVHHVIFKAILTYGLAALTAKIQRRVTSDTFTAAGTMPLTLLTVLTYKTCMTETVCRFCFAAVPAPFCFFSIIIIRIGGDGEFRNHACNKADG